MLIVMKFGGSSLATIEKLENAAKIIARKAQDGNKIVVVVSAQGKTTDELVKKAKVITQFPSLRENDVLLSTGEQISMSLMTMQLQKLGFEAVSLCGWQAGIHTNSHNGSASITSVDTSRVLYELECKHIVVVAGFQGVSENDDITTLGRGGSDTTAIALAAALKADTCCIYTDVNGVYSANPHVVTDAVKHNDITYNEMLEMSSLGAKVLHNRSVSMAQHSGVPFEVRSSFEDDGGTLVHELAPDRAISGIVCDGDISMITVSGIDSGNSTCALFTLLADNDITVDVILRSQRVDDMRGTVSFSVSGNICDSVMKLINDSDIKFERLSAEYSIAKISAVGAGLTDSCAVAAMILNKLNELGINPRYITTGEIRISVLIPADMAQTAEQALNTLFFAN